MVVEVAVEVLKMLDECENDKGDLVDSHVKVEDRQVGKVEDDNVNVMKIEMTS